jgi:hypothetical protein
MGLKLKDFREEETKLTIRIDQLKVELKAIRTLIKLNENRTYRKHKKAFTYIVPIPHYYGFCKYPCYINIPFSFS